ncbi:MAG: hypothetical protein K2X41_00965 [Hyphomicrobium sp.]|nr:hypothetical protein [Hyphomicrobium sp.]
MTDMSDRRQRLVRMAASVVEASERIKLLPLKERLAVALILNRPQLFPEGDFTILQAVAFLGEEWVKLAIEAEKAPWPIE